MLYDAYEVQRSLLAGASKMASMGAGWLNNPANPFSYGSVSPVVAASLDVFAHASAPRGKPEFGIEEIAVGKELVAIDEDTDGVINDGCPANGPAETSCADNADNDGDTFFNDGCPVLAAQTRSWVPDYTAAYFGISAMGFDTDWQKMAYVLKAGERDVPAGAKTPRFERGDLSLARLGRRAVGDDVRACFLRHAGGQFLGFHRHLHGHVAAGFRGDNVDVIGDLFAAFEYGQAREEDLLPVHADVLWLDFADSHLFRQGR